MILLKKITIFLKLILLIHVSINFVNTYLNQISANIIPGEKTLVTNQIKKTAANKSESSQL